MEDIALLIGCVLIGAGGFLLTSTILLVIGYALCCAWIAFSDTFRAICKAESLIYEYRKNRDAFLEWKEMEKDGKRTKAD